MTAWAPWIDKDDTFVVSVGNGSESLLPGGIPDLEFNIFTVGIDSFESEIDTNGSHVVLIELVISKPEQETWFSYWWISDDNVLEEVIVLSTSARHWFNNWFILFSKWNIL